MKKAPVIILSLAVILSCATGCGRDKPNADPDVSAPIPTAEQTSEIVVQPTEAPTSSPETPEPVAEPSTEPSSVAVGGLSFGQDQKTEDPSVSQRDVKIVSDDGRITVTIVSPTELGPMVCTTVYSFNEDSTELIRISVRYEFPDEALAKDLADDLKSDPGVDTDSIVLSGCVVDALLSDSEISSYAGIGADELKSMLEASLLG